MSNYPPNWCPPQPNNPYDYTANPAVINPNQPPENLARPPQDASLSSSLFCNVPIRPILITGLLRDILVRYFHQSNNNPDFDIRKYIWRNSPDTDIVIDSVHRWNTEIVGKRPAIFIKRNSYKNMRLAIGNRMEYLHDGHYSYNTMFVGSHTLFCIHSSGAGAEILATAVQRYLTEYSPVIIEYLNLFTFDVEEVGPISEIEEYRESYVVPVTVGWAFDQSWVLEMESLKLRRIILDFNIENDIERIME